MNELREAISRISIHELWQKYGLPLPHGFQLGRKFTTHSPFRKDEKISFSVWQSDNGWIFKDHATKEKGDSFTFFKLVSGISDNKEAVRTFLDIAGFKKGQSNYKPIKFNAVKNDEKSQTGPKNKVRPVAPKFIDSKPEHFNALAKLRGLSTEGLELAAKRGILKFAYHYDHLSWIITDPSGWSYQARRMDGKDWDFGKGDAKSLFITGSKAQWPVGTHYLKDFNKIILNEGGADLLTSYHYLHKSGLQEQILPISFLGAANTFSPKMLPYFSKKEVIIFGHNDPAGHESTKLWMEQLLSVGAKVHPVDFSKVSQMLKISEPINDLNDLAKADPGFNPKRLFGFFEIKKQSSANEMPRHCIVSDFRNTPKTKEFSVIPKNPENALVLLNPEKKSSNPAIELERNISKTHIQKTPQKII